MKDVSVWQVCSGRVRVGSLRHGVELWLDHLQDLGVLVPADLAVLWAVRILASACDADVTNAALWGRFLDSVRELKGDDTFVAGVGVVDPFEAFSAGLSPVSAAVSDEGASGAS
ncbi:MAG: hypothetical protein KAG66_12130 [Methylococcales bacterium]|nr:hypothetical protein [Methylococcales bacterium]